MAKRKIADLTAVKLKGLVGKETAKQVGHVYYRKYNATWNIYVSVKNSWNENFQIRPAYFGDTNLQLDVIEHLKKLARPFSTINDKQDNTRHKISALTIHHDEHGCIHSYTLRDAEELTEEKQAERFEILEKNPTYALFLTTPVLGN